MNRLVVLVAALAAALSAPSLANAQDPSIYFTQVPAMYSNSRSATFSYGSDDPDATFRCLADDDAQTVCPSPHTVTQLADGFHGFQVFAVDPSSGNSSATLKYNWHVDTTPPDTAITGGPAQGSVTNDSTPTFTFTSTEAGTFRCSIDGGAASACTSGISPALADGQHTFRVAARDQATNVDPTPASRTFTVDTTPPDTSISGPSGPTKSTSASFTLGSTEANSTFACAVDGGQFSNCSSPYNLVSLAQGPHTLQVRATDPVGNTDGSPASRTWVVDTTAPTASAPAQNLAASTLSSASATGPIPVYLSWAAPTDVGTGVQQIRLMQSVAGNPYTLVAVFPAGTTSTMRAVSPDLSSRFAIVAVDAAGNPSTPQQGSTFTPRTAQESAFTFGGSWASLSNAQFWGGALRYTGGTGTAQLIVPAGTRSIAVVVLRGPNMGTLQLVVDGTPVAAQSLASSSWRVRQVILPRLVNPAAAHTIGVRKSAGSWIALDGLIRLGT